LAVVSGGDELKQSETLRYGGRIDNDSTYRLYGKYTARDDDKLLDGSAAKDDWDMVRGGFRVDSGKEDSGAFTLQGDAYTLEGSNLSRQIVSFDSPYSAVIENDRRSEGRNILGRYQKKLSATSDFTLKAYYDFVDRRDKISSEKRDTFDFDGQHHLRWSDRQDLVYGLNYRITTDELGESQFVDWTPKHRTDSLVTAFLQDEITLVPETLSLIPGTKIGYNDYSGFEYQPALKSVWNVEDDSVLWGSISRAVRIPSRVDQDVKTFANPQALPDGSVITPTLYGTKGFDSEKLQAYEIGFRQQASETVSYDVTTYYNHYTDLLSLEPGQPFPEPPAPGLIFPLSLKNGLSGDSYGVEFATTWRPTTDMSFGAGYSYLETELSRNSGSQDTIVSASEGRSPHNQANLSAHFDLPRNFEFDTYLYYVDDMPANSIGSFLRTDARLGYKFNESLTLDLVGQDLFDSRHQEWVSDPAITIERSVFGRLTARF
jgi:iron complex outermembrane receptor protein